MIETFFLESDERRKVLSNALFCTILRKNLWLVQFLISKGATNVNNKNENGATPLSLAWEKSFLITVIFFTISSLVDKTSYKKSIW